MRWTHMALSPPQTQILDPATLSPESQPCRDPPWRSPAWPPPAPACSPAGSRSAACWATGTRWKLPPAPQPRARCDQPQAWRACLAPGWAEAGPGSGLASRVCADPDPWRSAADARWQACPCACSERSSTSPAALMETRECRGSVVAVSAGAGPELSSHLQRRSQQCRLACQERKQCWQSSSQGPAEAFPCARQAPSCFRPAACRPARGVISVISVCCTKLGPLMAVQGPQRPASCQPPPPAPHKASCPHLSKSGPSEAAAGPAAAAPASACILSWLYRGPR